jgi:hypothetical protein
LPSSPRSRPNWRRTRRRGDKPRGN